jgi:hypothetical protein
VPTYSLDEETHSRRYNYFEGGVAEPEPHVTEGATTVLHSLTLHMRCSRLDRLTRESVTCARTYKGAEHVFRATRRGVTEDIKPRLAPWKVENFTDEEIDKVDTTPRRHRR